MIPVDTNDPSANELAEYTVDSLAAAAGIMTTTVRMYQARGLLPAPRRRGRIGVYDDGHLRRLKVIAELQQRGHSLAGIAELLDSAAAGTPLTDLIGVDSLPPSTTVTLSLQQLIDRFAPATMSAATVQRAITMGLVTMVDDGVDVDEQLLRLGSELVAMGLPFEVVLDQWQELTNDATRIAARFTSLFETYIWPTIDAGNAPLASVTESVQRLAPIAQRVTARALMNALREQAEAFARRHGAPHTDADQAVK